MMPNTYKEATVADSKERVTTKDIEALPSKEQRSKLDDKSPINVNDENTLPDESEAKDSGQEGAQRYVEYVEQVRELEEQRVEEEDALARDRSGRPSKEQEEADAKAIAEGEKKTREEQRKQAEEDEKELAAHSQKTSQQRAQTSS